MADDGGRGAGRSDCCFDFFSPAHRVEISDSDLSSVVGAVMVLDHRGRPPLSYQITKLLFTESDVGLLIVKRLRLNIDTVARQLGHLDSQLRDLDHRPPRRWEPAPSWESGKGTTLIVHKGDHKRKKESRRIATNF
jgi:hypothetical protein